MIRYNIDKFLELEKLPQEKINVYGSNLKQNSLKKLLNQSKNKSEKISEKNSNVWVSPSLNHNVINDDDKTKLHVALSQLTEKNKDDIFGVILEIIKKNFKLIDLIYDCAIQQDYYSEIYSKLCVFIRDNINEDTGIEKKIINSLEIFFNNRLSSNNKYQNYIKFISYLNVNNFISNNIINKCIDNIINNLNNENINCSEEVFSLFNLYKITDNKIKDNYRQILENLSCDKNKIRLSKDRFKIKDIIEF
jgi:hypothetical protein